MSRMLQNLGRPPSVPLLFVPQEKESHGQAGLAKPWPLSGSLLFNYYQQSTSVTEEQELQHMVYILSAHFTT